MQLFLLQRLSRDWTYVLCIENNYSGGGTIVISRCITERLIYHVSWYSRYRYLSTQVLSSAHYKKFFSFVAYVFSFALRL